MTVRLNKRVGPYTPAQLTECSTLFVCCLVLLRLTEFIRAAAAVHVHPVVLLLGFLVRATCHLRRVHAIAVHVRSLTQLVVLQAMLADALCRHHLTSDNYHGCSGRPVHRVVRVCCAQRGVASKAVNALSCGCRRACRAVPRFVCWLRRANYAILTARCAVAAQTSSAEAGRVHSSALNVCALRMRRRVKRGHVVLQLASGCSRSRHTYRRGMAQSTQWTQQCTQRAQAEEDRPGQTRACRRCTET